MQGFFKVLEEAINETHSGLKKWVISKLVELIDSAKEEFGLYQGVFTQRTVTELLYGYDDPLLLSLHKDVEFLEKIKHFNLSINPRFNYSVSVGYVSPLPIVVFLFVVIVVVFLQALCSFLIRVR